MKDIDSIEIKVDTSALKPLMRELRKLARMQAALDRQIEVVAKMKAEIPLALVERK